MGRNWYYSIKWSQTGSQTRKSIVTVTSKPRTRDENQLVWVNSWTTHDRVIDGSEPVAVFAQVHLGSSPVINASVLLDVEVENENGTIFALLPISMQDNGRGGNANFYNFIQKVFEDCDKQSEFFIQNRLQCM